VSAPITLELSAGRVIKGEPSHYPKAGASIRRPAEASGADCRVGGHSREPARGQRRAQATTPNRSSGACSGNRQGSAPARKFPHGERPGADRPLLHYQFHWQTPQFALPILWEWPTLWTDRRDRMQDLRRLTIALLCVLLAVLQDARGEVVTIATWNLERFPGGKPNSSQSERLVHMIAAKDALLDIRPDILCLQEVRDWDSVSEWVSTLPNFQTLVVSRFRAMGSSGPLSIQQTAIASNRLPLRQSAMARPYSSSIPCISRATGAMPKSTSGSAKMPQANCSLTLPKWGAFT
jgi:hypothetical protein